VIDTVIGIIKVYVLIGIGRLLDADNRPLPYRCISLLCSAPSANWQLLWCLCRSFFALLVLVGNLAHYPAYKSCCYNHLQLLAVVQCIMPACQWVDQAHVGMVSHCFLVFSAVLLIYSPTVVW